MMILQRTYVWCTEQTLIVNATLALEYMILDSNFKQKLILDAPYKYYALSEIMACNFHLKLPTSTMIYYKRNVKLIMTGNHELLL